MKHILIFFFSFLLIKIASAQLPCPPDLTSCRLDPNLNCVNGVCFGGVRCQCLPPPQCGQSGQICCGFGCQYGLACRINGICSEVPIDTVTVGGDGGTRFYEMCPHGGLAGLSIKTEGSFINSVQGICVPRDWRRVCKRKFLGICIEKGDFDFKRTKPVGGEGGVETVLMCDPHTNVKAIFGGAGVFVDRLGIECGSVSGDEGLIEESVELKRLGPVGGPGGTDFVAECRGANVATGLGGRSGSLVDKIGLYCYVAESD